MSGPSTSDAVIDPYQPFSHGKSMTFSLSSPFVPQYLQSALPPSTNASHVYTSRLKGKQLVLENPARESRSKQLRDQRAERRRKDAERRQRGVMGRREGKTRGIWEVDKADARWALFLPIHHLWLGYIAELLALPNAPSDELLRNKDPKAHRMPNVPAMQAKIVKADLHGSILTVKRAKNPDLVGVGGIVVHETENTLKVITAHDQLKVIPKRNSIFSLRIPLYATKPSHAATGTGEEQGPQMEFELYGNQICFRSSERASRKFKYKETIEL